METIAVVTSREISRFWEKVEVTGDCWAWKAFIHPVTGYAFFHFHGKTGLAHRFAFEMEHGPIPAGMQVDHTCHNRSCTNPAHLRLATPKQNNENPAGLYGSNTSGVSGVRRDKRRNGWIAVVSHHGRRHYVGRFDDIEDARKAVVAKRNELFTHNDADRCIA